MLRIAWLAAVLWGVHCQTYYAYSASSNNIVSICHCDLTSDFCDYNCCCDPECADSVKNALRANGQPCATNTLQSYCFDSSYYARINVRPAAVAASGRLTCYSFEPDKVQAEVNVSDSQMEELVKADTPQAVPYGNYSAGYSTQTPILTTNSKLVGDGGGCLTSTNGSARVTVMFGRNLTISCSSSSTQCSKVTLFTSIMGSTLHEFLGEEGGARQIPSQSTSQCLSTLTVLIFYNRLGVSRTGIPYIVQVRNIEEASPAVPRTYTLKLRFIDLSGQLNAPEQITSPGFFPQIPPDMFYPIFYSWAARLTILIISLILVC